MLENVINPSDLRRFSRWLRWARRFVIVSHVSPDGDAIGSSLALYHWLTSMGKRVVCMTPNPFPDFLKWMPGIKAVMPYTRYSPVAGKFIDNADVIICVDFNDLKRLDALGEPIAASKAKKIMIDHHLEPEQFCDITVSFPHMCSASEVVFRFMDALGYYPAMSKEAATCIYTGMMTDTGAFTYNSNQKDIYTIIGALLEKGIDKDEIYRKVYNTYHESRLRLQGHVLTNMKIYPDCHAALITLTREELKHFGFKRGDSEGFVNMPLSIKDIIFSGFLREDTEKDEIKVSLRSLGEFPCNEFAKAFGGGGHKNASGGEIKQATMEEAIRQFEAVLEQYKPLLNEHYEQEIG